MLEYQKSAVTSLEVFRVVNPKNKPVYVEGRHFYSLTYRKKGNVIIDIGRESISSRCGHVTYMPKEMPYETTVLEESEIIALHFSMDKECFFPLPFTAEDTTGLLSALFEEMAQKYNPNDPYNFELYSLFYQILSIVEIQMIRKEQKDIHPGIRQAKQLIDANFRNKNFNISVLVEMLEISDSFLRREFKKAFGMSPVQYLSKVRIQSAKTALLSDYYSVEFIAEQNGFCSSSYFIQVFRKETGVSPLNYKKTIMAETSP